MPVVKPEEVKFGLYREALGLCTSLAVVLKGYVSYQGPESTVLAFWKCHHYISAAWSVHAFFILSGVYMCPMIISW